MYKTTTVGGFPRGRAAHKNIKKLWTVSCALLLMVWGFYGTFVPAHEIRPTVATVTFDGYGRYSIQLSVNAEALLAGVSPSHQDTDDSPQVDEYNRLRALSSQELKARIRSFESALSAGLGIRFDKNLAQPRMLRIDVPGIGDLRRARISTVFFAGLAPDGAENFSWAYAPEFGSSALKIQRAGVTEEIVSWLDVGEESEPFPLAGIMHKRSWWETVWRYTSLGFTHIVPKGMDHILFVLGLFLLSVRLKSLLWQVSAFTVAHSITLGLTIYGVVSLSPTIVEPLIALSLVYVAVENLITSQLKPWRVLIVFCFGLLHGMGFAGLLQAIGLPRSDFLTALIAFNAGVEFAQLTIIVVALLVVGIWVHNKHWYRGWIVIPGSLIIGAVGLYWTWERVSQQLIV